MKVLVAMSGGVDSSVAASLLKKEGHEVIGLSFELWDKRDLEPSNLCCSVETINLAKKVALDIGIDHYTVDVRDDFYTYVIQEFCNSYIEGTTPNPCILCNRHIKFPFLLRKAAELGADMVATGHYARVEHRELSKDRITETQGKAHHTSGKGMDYRYILKKGIDPVKDQSYFLYVMKQKELAKTLFPLGSLRKETTRAIARETGIATAMRPESQEICFVGNDRYADFIRGFSPESVQPGEIVDTGGRRLGEHRGIAFYTPGQRRGIGIAHSEPLYVVRIEKKSNQIIVGTRNEAMVKTFAVHDLNWISIPSLKEDIKADVRVRSTMKPVPAVLSPGPDRVVSVTFEEPQWAPAPGQSAVFYLGDTVAGGGIIA